MSETLTPDEEAAAVEVEVAEAPKESPKPAKASRRAGFLVTSELETPVGLPTLFVKGVETAEEALAKWCELNGLWARPDKVTATEAEANDTDAPEWPEPKKRK